MVTTCGYTSSNFAGMTARKSGFAKTKAQRRRTFIAAWREFRGMTQEQLAEELDTTKATISRIEGGVSPYSQDFLEACADALGVHQGVLITRGPSDVDRTAAASVSPTARTAGRQR